MQSSWLLSPRRFSLALLTAVLLLLLSSPASAGEEFLPFVHPTYKAIRTVYDRVARAFADQRQPPRLLVSSRPLARPAAIDGGATLPDRAAPFFAVSRDETVIVVDQRLYEALAVLGPERESALALILGHDLAHFYLRHRLGRDGLGFADHQGDARKPASEKAGVEAERKRLKNLAALETEAEADYYGGFYGFLAGYDTTSVANRTFDLVYGGLNKAETNGYPELAARKEIVAGVEQRLRELRIQYETANRLLVIRRYAEAARLYGRIATQSPSCEILTNAAVAWAGAALAAAPGDRFPYLYPFLLDRESSLDRRNQQRSREGAGTAIKRSPVGQMPEPWEESLQKAAILLDQALTLNPAYAPALVNRAAVAQMSGDGDAVQLYLRRAEKVAAGESPVMAAIHLVRGIVMAEIGDKDGAAQEFRAAALLGSRQADRNLGILLSQRDEVKPPVATVSGAPLTVDGLAIPAGRFLLERPDLTLRLREADGESLVISRQQFPYSERWTVSFLDRDREERLLVAFHETSPVYSASLRGIRVGSSTNEVMRLFGPPTRLVPSRQGEYWGYEGDRLVFQTRAGETVEGWFLYGVYE